MSSSKEEKMIATHPITYLTYDTRLQTRTLYEQAFSEDCKEFVDYYYAYKVPTNRIAVIEDAGHILSMIHLNPYPIMLRGQNYMLDYIVAVATDESHKRQGLMRAILTRVLMDMARERKPFTYLMPADEAYYTPFGFTYITDVEKPILESYQKLDYSPSLAGEMAQFARDVQARKYDIYNIKDEEYFDDVNRQLSCAGGRLSITRDSSGTINSIIQDEYADGRGFTRILTDMDVKELPTSSHGVMARILDLEEMISHIGLKSDSETESLVIKVFIIDEIIAKNHGLFALEFTRRGGRARRLVASEEAIATQCKSVYTNISISELTAWLFGYQKIPSIDPMDIVDTIHGICIAEQV